MIILYRPLVRYIHLNPIGVNIVSDLKLLSRYPHCGHSAIIGRKRRSGRIHNILGYDLNTVAEKVARIYGIDSAELFRRGRQKPRVDAKVLFCYWAARELKITLTDLARKFEMTISGVGYAAQSGEAIALRHNFHWLD